jgi:hypothetical protein
LALHTYTIYVPFSGGLGIKKIRLRRVLHATAARKHQTPKQQAAAIFRRVNPKLGTAVWWGNNAHGSISTAAAEQSTAHLATGRPQI